MTLFLYIFLLGLLTYWGAWISASETALFSLSSTKVKAYEKDADPRKKGLAKLLFNARDLLVTIFMVNTLLNILTQNVASSLFGPDGSWLLKIGVPLALTLILGEIIPKYYGMQNNISFSLKVSDKITFLHKVLKPLRQAIVKITAPISRTLFFFLKKEQPLTKDELEHVVKTSEEKGLLQPDEGQLLSGYFDLQDEEVKEIMWPRGDMITYDISQPLSKLEHLIIESEVTRLPVVDKSVDHVLGIIDAYTYFMHLPSIKTPADLIPLLKKPLFVPEATPARTLLKKINKEENELVLVVDEYGAISGLVTREDLLEVVVGPIIDSRDNQADFTRSSENEIIASGKMQLDDLNSLFDTHFISKNNLVTLGGWLTEQLGEIPKVGTRYEKEGISFQVLASQPTHVERLYIRREKNG